MIGAGQLEAAVQRGLFDPCTRTAAHKPTKFIGHIFV